MREALFYDKLYLGENLDSRKVRCQLCPHQCIISPEQTGICRSRQNIDGKLYAINYGKTVSFNIDPIEKKPLYHFYPQSRILSLGANSCNFHCDFCQNHQISQTTVPTQDVTPKIIADLCRKHQLDSVAFTYTEPFMWYEFIYDAAKFLKQRDIKIVLVTNGYINPAPLAQLLPLIDAMNIDLKAYDDEFYKTYCGGSLLPVLETIKLAANQTHVEITNLLIPGLNDSPAVIDQLVDFVAEVNDEIPLHFSRYFPAYKMQLSPTPIEVVINAAEAARGKLKHVYLGNMFSDNFTICSKCGNLLIDRNADVMNLINGCCRKCGKKLYGKFDETA